MFKSSSAYGNTLNSYDACKLLALAAMIADHLGNYFWPDALWLRAAGRLAFPLFLFLAGYSGNWKIMPDFIALAVMVTLCAALTHHPVFPLNILVSIAVTRVIMRLFTRREMEPRYVRGIFIIAVVWYPLFLWHDYSTVALLFAMCGYLRRQETARIYRPPEKAEEYAPPARTEGRNNKFLPFLYATVILHFALEWYFFRFRLAEMPLFLSVAAITFHIMRNFQLKEISLPIPDWIRFPLRWAARNTLPLYAGHIMIFMTLERVYFPARLAHFQWF